MFGRLFWASRRCNRRGLLRRSEALASQRRGSILILTLWAAAILSAFSVSTGYHVRQKISLATRIDQTSSLQGIAEAGIAKALAVVLEPDTSQGYDMLNDSWSTNELPFKEFPMGEGRVSVSYEYTEVAFGKVKIRYGLQDEEGKINLNKADAPTISRLFQIAGDLDSDEADETANAIVDWRDPDSFLNHPGFEAEDDYYEDLDPPYGAKDGPFEVFNEILLVRGMTPELFERIKDKVTLYGSGAVNINTASKEVLRAVGMEEGLADLVLSYRAGTNLEEGTTDDRGFTSPGAITSEISRVYSLSGADLAVLSNLASAGTLTTESGHFRVYSRAELGEGRVQLVIEAVFDRSGKIHYYRMGFPVRGASPAAAGEEKAVLAS